MRLAITPLALALSLSFPILAQAQSNPTNEQLAIGVAGNAYTHLADTLVGIDNPDTVPFSIPSDTEALTVSTDNFRGGEEADYPLMVTPATKSAARFLTQSTFGPTAKSITYLADEIELKGEKQAFSDWIDRQLSAPITNYHKRFIGQGACNWCNTNWWWDHTLTAPDQLRQRVGWALSQIMVVSILGYNKDGPLAHYYQTLLNGSLGDFRSLMTQVSRHTAMASYLDNRNNFVPTDPNQHVNENYARELMQLFTLGTVMLDKHGLPQTDKQGVEIPAYTETDIEQLAHALAGLKGGGLKLYVDNRVYDHSTKTLFAGTSHEVVLNTSGDGSTDFEAALDAIFQHPNVAPFISKQLIQHLVTSNPSKNYVSRVTRVFKDTQGDLGQVVKTILLDKEARKARNARSTKTKKIRKSKYGKLKSPVRQTANVTRAAEFRAPYIGNSMASIHFPLAALSVFSFYQPSDSPQGEIQEKKLVAPEFTLATTKKMTKLHNMFTKLILQEGLSKKALANSNSMKYRPNNDHELALAVHNPEALIDRYNLLLLGGQMSKTMKKELVDYITAIPTDDQGATRVKEALYIIATSTQQAIQQ